MQIQFIIVQNIIRIIKLQKSTLLNIPTNNKIKIDAAHIIYVCTAVHKHNNFTVVFCRMAETDFVSSKFAAAFAVCTFSLQRHYQSTSSLKRHLQNTSSFDLSIFQNFDKWFLYLILKLRIFRSFISVNFNWMSRKV